MFGRLAGRAKIRAGWLAATADQQFSWSPNAGPYESCGHAESGSQTVDNEIRTIICTTNAIESINARLRRALKARGHFPDKQAALKCL